MSVKTFIGNKSARENAARKLYKDERSFRADRLVEAWMKVPEIGEGLEKLPEAVARNVAINLQQQARLTSRLTEMQRATAFDGQKPENMLRLTRLAMPSVIRNQVFTEYALESMYDTIKYLRPKVTKNQKGTNNMARRHSDGVFGNASDDTNPWGIGKGDDFNQPDNADGYQKALYEQSGDRFVQEMANALVLMGTDADGKYKIGTKEIEITGAVAEDVYIVFGKKADDTSKNEFDLGYRDGYVTIFGASEQDTLAIQNRDGGFFVNTADHAGVTVAPVDEKIEGAFVIKGLDLTKTPVVKAYGRYDCESDFEGDNLGQIELGMTTYKFNPRPVEIGISFSMLADVTLDVTFGVSIEDELMNYGAQEIKAALDRQAFKYAYHIAKTNPAAYRVDFEAGWTDAVGASDIAAQKRGYIENAQTFPTAVLKVADVMLNDIKRGGVSRMVGGPSAVSYMTLIGGFSGASEVSFVGPHKFGELNNTPVFKVPSDIIPTDEVLCVWKNDMAEGDVSIVFGTLIPFISTGLIQRANFYTEAGLANISDYNCLNRKYLSLIKIKNMKDTTAI